MPIPPAKTSDSSGRERISPFFQTLAIFVTAIFLMVGFYIRDNSFQTIDEPIRYETLTPQSLREFGGYPDYISVGLNINRFEEFDVIKNKFQFAGSVWFDLEAGAVSLETLQHFSFDRGTILYRSEPDTSLNGTRLMVRYLVRVAFNTGLSYADFPVDNHRINLVLTNPFISPEEIILETKVTDFTFEGTLHPFGWKKLDHSVKSGFMVVDLSEYSDKRQILEPIVGFSLDIAHYGLRYILSILLPIFLIYFVMFFSFSVDSGPGISIVLGGITGMLAYRYVIERLSPTSGDMMLSDQFFFLILTSGIFIFLLNIIDLFFLRLATNIKKMGILAIHLFTCGAALYLLST